ncbi:MAG: hypothetical protein KF742_02450 [Cryobacterium sp.]|nr:hypothetical protein [Cryobacterium sp.]
MKLTTRQISPLMVLAGIAALTLSGCGASPSPDSEDDRNEGNGADAPCVVGTWDLDVAEYEASSIGYFASLPLPVQDFQMDGDGTIKFTEDGLVASEMNLQMTGLIVFGEVSVPFNTPSTYKGNGEWSAGETEATLDFANWVNTADSSPDDDPSAPSVPTIDYSTMPSVNVQCTADTLRIQAPEAPFASVWHR